MKPITSVKEAMALPEKQSFSIRKEKQPDGTTLIIPYFRELVAVDMDDKAILLFEDKDGRVMQIGYDTEGAYKYEGGI